MDKFSLDDKNLVIICATMIAILSMFVLVDPTNVVMNIITGMMGIATGQAMK